MNWKLRTGKFLFKYRSFTPVPLIIFIVLFFRPMTHPKYDLQIILVGFFLMVLGEVIRVFSVGFSFPGTSGRENFLRAENLNISGIYSIVRNPLYVGNIFIYTGILITYSNIYALLVFDLILILQYYFIIKSEENFLFDTYGSEYIKYKDSVNSIIPNFRNYCKPENPFDKVKVILKENDSVFNSFVIFGTLLLYKEYIAAGNIVNKKLYFIYFGILIILYIFIKLLKKHYFRNQTRIE